MTQITAIWTKKETPLKVYEMNEGHLLSIGSSVNKSNNILIIKNVKPDLSHRFTFGDEK